MTLPDSSLVPDSARAIALDVLDAILRRRQSLEDALAGHPDHARLAPRDRHFLRALLGAVLRHLGEIDHVLGLCLEKPLPARAAIVRQALRLGIGQILFLATPAHAAVDSMVELTGLRGEAGFKGLVNAVLRRVARDAEDFRQKAAAIVNLPDWLWQSWSTAYGLDKARAIIAGQRREPPLDFAIKKPETRTIWAEALGAFALPNGGLRRPAVAAEGERRSHQRIEDWPGYAEGAWWIQDFAAQLPVELLGDVAGRRIADLCAAPGGKTAQLAARGAIVTALERSPRRLARLTENLRRLDLPARLELADATLWQGESDFDAILLDAPCSATGTIRRHPDIAWLKSRRDLQKLLPMQDRLLDAALRLVRVGGSVVYATCSLQPEEGEARIESLLARAPDVARRPIRPEEIFGFGEWITAKGDLRTLPADLAEIGGMDGFFAARLVRLR